MTPLQQTQIHFGQSVQLLNAKLLVVHYLKSKIYKVYREEALCAAGDSFTKIFGLGRIFWPPNKRPECKYKKYETKMSAKRGYDWKKNLGLEA